MLSITKKKYSTRKPLIACVAALAVAATSAGSVDQLAAQQSTSDNNRARQTQEDQKWSQSSSSQADMKSVDHFLASKLILCNNGQIKAANMIQEKTSSEEVQAYARKIVEDHKSFNTMLQSMATYDVKPVLLASAEQMDDQPEGNTQKSIETTRRVASSQVTDVTNPDTAQNGRAVQETSMREVRPDSLTTLFNVAKQAANIQETQCKEMFSRYEGYDLDMAYVGSQIMAHQMMKSELTAISETTNGDLKSTADKGLTIVENHLQHATRLSKALETMKADGNYKSEKDWDQKNDSEWEDKKSNDDDKQ